MCAWREAFAHEFQRANCVQAAWRDRDVLLLFLRGFVGVLVVFAIATYAFTQSAWTTFIQTVICAVLIQIGYFVAVLFLVWRPAAKRTGQEQSRIGRTRKSVAEEDQPAGKWRGCLVSALAPPLNQAPGTSLNRLRNSCHEIAFAIANNASRIRLAALNSPQADGGVSQTFGVNAQQSRIKSSDIAHRHRMRHHCSEECRRHHHRAIRSALRENRVAEVVVVDDGSTDGTAAASRAADDGSGRLRVLSLETNRGPAFARNHAIANSYRAADRHSRCRRFFPPRPLRRLLDGGRLGFRRRQHRLHRRESAGSVEPVVPDFACGTALSRS